jgi:hypothetical protein
MVDSLPITNKEEKVRLYFFHRFWNYFIMSIALFLGS